MESIRTVRFPGDTTGSSVRDFLAQCAQIPFQPQAKS